QITSTRLCCSCVSPGFINSIRQFDCTVSQWLSVRQVSVRWAARASILCDDVRSKLLHERYLTICNAQSYDVHAHCCTAQSHIRRRRALAVQWGSDFRRHDRSTVSCSMTSCAAVSCLCNVHRNQQPREPVKGTGIHFGDLLDAIETKINCVGVDLETARGQLDVEIALRECADRAANLSGFRVQIGEPAHPVGDEPQRGRVLPASNEVQ